MLNIQHFTKTYGEKRAVDDLSLHIAPGEIYGFIGHNGAGKTTTLKAAVGILQFDAGEITIGGHSIQTEPLACKQLLAYIPDNPDLYDFMSGIQYLNFIADVFGIPAATSSTCVEKKIAPPTSHSSRIMPLSRCAAFGSRPTNGSSMMMSFGFMSGIQYLNFIADVFGIPAAERWARIEPYADAFELTGDLGRS